MEKTNLILFFLPCSEIATYYLALANLDVEKAVGFYRLDTSAKKGGFFIICGC